MKNFKLDPNEGPHAASRLSDEMLEYLHRITSLELAIRMSVEIYRERFRTIAEERKTNDAVIQRLRVEREQMRFAAEVQAGLDQLPLTTDMDSDQGFGMYF